MDCTDCTNLVPQNQTLSSSMFFHDNKASKGAFGLVSYARQATSAKEDDCPEQDSQSCHKIVVQTLREFSHVLCSADAGPVKTP